MKTNSSVDDALGDLFCRYEMLRSYSAALEIARIYRFELDEPEKAEIWLEKAYYCGPRTAESARNLVRYYEETGQGSLARRWSWEARKCAFIAEVMQDSRFREDFVNSAYAIEKNWTDIVASLRNRDNPDFVFSLFEVK